MSLSEDVRVSEDILDMPVCCFCFLFEAVDPIFKKKKMNHVKKNVESQRNTDNQPGSAKSLHPASATVGLGANPLSLGMIVSIKCLNHIQVSPKVLY